MVFRVVGDDFIVKERRVARTAVMNLVVFSIIMMIAPVLGYFAARSVYMLYFDTKAEEAWNPEHIGAFAAVFIVHLIMGSFCWVAWREDVSEAPEEDSLEAAKDKLEKLKAYVAEKERLAGGEKVTDAVVESKKVDDAPAAEKAAPTVEDMQSAVTDEETKKDL